MPSIPILHMGSFSRSGETLVLRTLDAHPRLEVVHQLREPDDPRDIELFHYLRKRCETSINLADEHAAHRRLSRDSILLLKNAVWEHRYPFNGFILVRNPFSIMASAYVTRETAQGFDNHKQQLHRWGRAIAPELVPFLMSSDNLTAFSVLHDTGLPILHYERFVTNPRASLQRLLGALGIDWEEAVTSAHSLYPKGLLGHGKIKLWTPINDKSLNKHHDRLSEHGFNKVYALTATTLRLHGYEVNGREVEVRADTDCRM